MVLEKFKTRWLDALTDISISCCKFSLAKHPELSRIKTGT